MASNSAAQTSTSSVSEDSTLLNDVAFALRRCGYSDLNGVEISSEKGIVRLHGRVPSYYLKQRAQVAALGVRGVLSLHNDLDVKSVS